MHPLGHVHVLVVFQVDSVNPNAYVNGIIGVSTFVSFYGHLLFYKATKSALHGYGLRAKFFCIIVVLVLCGLQSGILETMGALEAIPCMPPFSVLTRSQRKSRHWLFSVFFWHLTNSSCGPDWALSWATFDY